MKRLCDPEGRPEQSTITFEDPFFPQKNTLYLLFEVLLVTRS